MTTPLDMPVRRSTLQLVMLTLIAFLILGGSALYAYLCLFTNFASYDDEGYLMMTVKVFSEGYKLYDQIITPYGPMYYVYQSFLHTVLKIPLSDNATRLTTVVVWIAAALIPALCAWQLTQRVSLAATVYFLTFFYLKVLTNGPGHPGELALLLVEVAVAMPLLAGSKRPRLLAFGFGTLASAAIMTKLNIGVFLSLSLFLALLITAGEFWFVRLVRYATIATALALPFVLLRAHLMSLWGFSLAATITLSLANVAIPASILRRSIESSRLALFAISGIGTAFFLLLFALVNGSTPRGLLDSLIITPSRLAAFFHSPIRVAAKGIPVAMISLVFAITHARFIRGGVLDERSKYAHGFAVVKALFGVGVFLYALIFYNVRVHYVFFAVSYATPFLWLALSPFPAHGREQGNARIILCLVTVLQPLQIFPVPGDQAYLGTVLFILVAGVCLGDVLDWFDHLYGEVPFAVMIRRMSLPLILGSIVLLLAWRSYNPYRIYRSDVYQTYHTHLSFDAPGATRLHVIERQAAVFRWLIANVDRFSDTFYCNTGLNSLYFWTGKQLPGTIIMGNEVDIFTDEQQTTLVDSLSKYPDLCIIFHPNLFGRTSQSRIFLDYIDKEFVTCGRFDDYEFRVKKGRTPPLFVECATWIDDDESSHAGGIWTANLEITPMPGRLIDRVCVYDVGRRVVVADSRSLDPETMLILGNIQEKTEGIDLSIPQQRTLSLIRSLDLKGPLVVRLLDQSGRIVKSLPFLEPTNIPQTNDREKRSNSK